MSTETRISPDQMVATAPTAVVVAPVTYDDDIDYAAGELKVGGIGIDVAGHSSGTASTYAHLHGVGSATVTALSTGRFAIGFARFDDTSEPHRRDRVAAYMPRDVAEALYADLGAALGKDA